MVLRLILVSLVAGLGFEMPTRREMDTMARSAQQWVKTRLAEWDPQAPSDHESFVLVADPAQNSLPSAVPTPAPVSVQDDEFVDVLKDNVALFAQDELAGMSREMDQVVKSSDHVVALDPSKSFAIDLPTEPATVVSEEWISNDVTEIAFEGWADEATSAQPMDTVASIPTHELDLAFEGVIQETIIDFALDATTVAQAVRNSETDLIEVEANLSSTESNSPNPSSTDIQASIPTADETGRAGNRLTNAVRLTREAVVAWASLLHGPAVVTIAP